MKRRNRGIPVLLLLLLGSLFIWNCKDEQVGEAENSLQNKGYTLEKLSFSEFKKDKEIQKVLPLLQQIGKNNGKHQEKQEEVVEGLFINTSEVHKIIQEETISWTFQIDTPVLEASSLENFLVKKHDNVFSYFLISYQESNAIENKYQKAYLYKIPEKYLNLGDLNLSSKDVFDWETGNGGGGEGGSLPCEGVIYDQPCSNGDAYFHNPESYTDGGFCSGSIRIIDFSNCDNGTLSGPSNGLPIDGSTDGNLSSGGGGAAPGGTGSTATSPVDIQDESCPPGSGKIKVNDVCQCPTGKVENKEGKCIDDDCNTTKDDLKKIFTTASDSKLTEIADAINTYGKDFGIDNKEKLRHFLSQAGHESAKMTAFEENLNYRWKKLGIDYWKKHFNPHTDGDKDLKKEDPNDYKRSTTSVYVKKEDFANRVYDDAYRKKGYKLGNTSTGDGYKYRGRGIIQLTGKANYEEFNTFYQDEYDKNKNLVTTPDLVKTEMKIAVISALWFFKNKVIDKLTIDNTTSVLSVTEKVNGGDTGLKDRKELYNKAKENIDCK